VASGLPKFTRLEDAQFVMDPGGEVDISDLPDLSDANMKTEILNCVTALARNRMEVFLIDTMHAQLRIPAFYTIIPGTHFRERSLGTSVAMFSAKHIYENNPPAAAIAQLHHMDKLLPGKYYVHFYLGASHLALQDLQTAVSCFRRALALNPTAQDRISICSYLASALKDMGAYREALEILREAEKLDQERTDVYNLMGFCHYKLKEHPEAVANFKKVIRLDPSSAIDYANIAVNYRQMGATEKAIRYFKMALTLDDSIQFAIDHLAALEKKE
jgi:ribosomal protein S12 methylthiotransferase accessory factor